MRHRKKKTISLNTGIQKKSLLIRNLLTSFVEHWKISTTKKKAFVLKAKTNSFLSKTVSIMWTFDDKKEARREAKRFIQKKIFWDKLWKKVVDEIIPKCILSKKSSYVSDYKLWNRKWDWAEKVLLKLEM